MIFVIEKDLKLDGLLKIYFYKPCRDRVDSLIHRESNMTVWKLCMALIREYGLFAELKNLDFSKFAPLVNKKTTIPLSDGTTLEVNYREVDKLLRTFDGESSVKDARGRLSEVKDIINNKPVI